jgi:hypothetical protein
LSVSDKYLDNKPFFSELSSIISSDSFANKFASYLYYEAGVSKPEDFTNMRVYETEAKQVMKALSKNSVASFVDFMNGENLEYNIKYKQSKNMELDSDYILSKDSNVSDNYSFKSSELYAFYKQFCDANGFKHVNQKIFKVDMEYCGVYFNKGRIYNEYVF